MKLWKNLVLWYLGGMGYVAMELLWRGWSHGSMFVVGGVCFLLLGALRRLEAPLVMRMVLGACAVTGVELLSGLALNLWLGLRVWDYSGLPYNFKGQICLSYFFLWNLAALFAMGMDRLLRGLLFGERPPAARFSPGSGRIAFRSPE